MRDQEHTTDNSSPRLRDRFRGAADGPLRRTLLAGALAGGLLIGGTVSVAGGQQPHAHPGSANAAASTLNEATLEERTTVAEAARRARSLGRPVEALALRTDTRSVFVNPSGSRSAKLYSAPVRVRDEGRWRSLDVGLADVGGEVRSKAAAADIAFSDGADRSLARVAGEGGSLGLSWKGDRLPEPELDGAEATYRDVEPGIDLAVEARPQGFDQRVVVRRAPSGKLVLRFGLSSRGHKAQLRRDGGLELRDGRGRRVAVADPARMSGAQVDRRSGEPLREARVATRLLERGGEQVLELRPDPAFLRSAEGPVTISSLANLSANADTYVSSDSPSANYAKSTDLRSGSYNGRNRHRSLVRFPRREGGGSYGISGIPKGARVTMASMQLYNYHSWSNQPRVTDLYRVAGSWGLTSTTWSRQPTVGARYGSASFAKGWSSASPAGWVSFPITALAQKWVSDEVPNHGVRVQPRDEWRRDVYNWRKFRSGNYGNGLQGPYVVVTYEPAGV